MRCRFWERQNAGRGASYTQNWLEKVAKAQRSMRWNHLQLGHRSLLAEMVAVGDNGRLVGVVMSHILLTLSIAATASVTPASVHLSGQVLAASGKGTVHVALWQADGFLKHPVQEVRFGPGKSLAFHFDVTPGRYALSAFEDLNGNDILDLGLIGPKEPSGFWRPFGGWHKPRFDEVASQFEGEAHGLDIVLK
jgi:uncharacterized protein (DUF2141 family)